MRPELDAAYTLIAALRQQPDPDGIRAARDYWRSMMAENRRFWENVAQEDDDDREWIPNTRQTGVFGITVGGTTADAWQSIFADAEALFDGRLLIPHPLLSLEVGISLKSYVEDPGPIDLIDWIHGIGAAPYVARGATITGQR